MRLAFSLFSILLGVYLLTYRGTPLSGDELAMFSSTESLVRYGESRLYSVYYQYPGAGEIPWSKPVHEPMQTLLSIPLYWTAFQLDSIGMLHTVWLLNVLVLAGTGVLIYFTGITLGYSEKISFATALLISLGTMLWPYSQTYFREPLAAFLVMLAFWIAFSLQKRWQWGLALLLLIVCTFAMLTKEIMFLTFPALLLVLWPAQPSRKTLLLWTASIFIGLIFIVVVVSAASETSFGSNRFDSDNYVGRAEESNLTYFLDVLGAYLISPGRSIWATSPILLLSIYGSYLIYQKNWRLAFAPWLLLLTVTTGYAIGGWDWHGGLGWGTRYLLHVVPVMGLLLLPVVKKYFTGEIHPILWIIGALLLAFSVIVQIGGVLVPTATAFNILLAEFPEKGALAFQEEGVWQPQYAGWYLHLKQLDWNQPAVAWRYANPGIGIAVLFIMTGTVFAGWKKSLFLQGTLYLILWIFGLGVALNSLRDDPRFYAHRPELQALLASVEQQAGENDLVLLSNPEYLYFFLNNYRGKATLVTLPYLEGERYSANQPEPIVPDIDGDGVISGNERLDSVTSRAINYLNQQYDNVWFVTNTGPFLEWAYRPVEETLTSFYYPVVEQKWNEDARLIRIYPYLNYPLPQIVTRRIPHEFGKGMFLIAHDAPLRIEAGSVMPVTLVWKKMRPIHFNYNVGVLLVDENGMLRAQHDGPPQATFGSTATWQMGILYRDLHGLALPADLPPGTYRLLVVMYDWRDAVRLPVTYRAKLMEGDAAEIAEIEIVAKGEFTPVQASEIADHLPEAETAYLFGDAFRLIGYEFPETARAETFIPITTTWDISQGGNYNTTVMLKKDNYTLSAVNGLAISLFNEQFHDGRQTYRHEIYIPANFPRGKYDVIVSVFNWEHFTQLPVTPGETGTYEAVVGTVEINSP